MFLTKIILFWPACRNPYQWHQAIWQLFPNRPEAKRNFLFSCLNRRTGRDISALLFSIEKPERIRSAEITLDGEPKSLAMLSFRQGQLLRFRLTANPTKVLTEANEEKRKIRVPLIKPEQQEAWLKRKLEGIAIVENVTIQNEAPLYFSQKSRGGKIVPVVFEGIVKVMNAEKFREQLYEEYDKKGVYIAGIGSAKAFGCGLMLVQKL